MAELSVIVVEDDPFPRMLRVVPGTASTLAAAVVANARLGYDPIDDFRAGQLLPCQ